MPWTELGQFTTWKNAISVGSRTRQPLSAAAPENTFLQAELTQKMSAANAAPEETNPDSPHPAALAGTPWVLSEVLFPQALPKKGPWLRSLPGGQAQSGRLSGHRAKNNVELPDCREQRHSHPEHIKVIFLAGHREPHLAPEAELERAEAR